MCTINILNNEIVSRASQPWHNLFTDPSQFVPSDFCDLMLHKLWNAYYKVIPMVISSAWGSLATTIWKTHLSLGPIPVKNQYFLQWFWKFKMWYHNFRIQFCKPILQLLVPDSILTRCFGDGVKLKSPVTTTSLWISSFKHFLVPGEMKNLTPKAKSRRRNNDNFISKIK